MDQSSGTWCSDQRGAVSSIHAIIVAYLAPHIPQNRLSLNAIRDHSPRMADVANVPAQPILNVGTDRICVRKATKSDTTAILRNHVITMEEHIERERDFTETTPFAE